jgi:putative chitinase
MGEAFGPPLPALLRAAGFGDADAWAAALVGPMRLRSITGSRRVAAFLATIAHESNGGRVLVESMSYSAERIAAVWPRRFASPAAAAHLARKPEALANAVYGGRMGNTAPGDGWRFRGRGLIQLTGRSNYGLAGTALGLPLLADPDIAATREGAAATACWWWAAHGCNALADAGDLEVLRRRVNGGVIGLDDVRRRYVVTLAAIGQRAA